MVEKLDEEILDDVTEAVELEDTENIVAAENADKSEEIEAEAMELEEISAEENTETAASSQDELESASETENKSEVGRDVKAEVENVIDDAKKSVPVDNELLQILNAQNDVLECMLTQQKKIHDNVKDRKWVELEACIDNMKAYSDAFVNLDQCRENYVGDNRDLYLEPGIQEVYVSVRTKLSKSKIENSALATYVSSTKEFIDGVIENCVPQSKTRVYGRNGKITSPMAESVVLDALV